MSVNSEPIIKTFDSESSNTPINKGNFILDTHERELLFKTKLAEGWEKSYAEYRSLWVSLAKKKKYKELPITC